MRKKGKKSLCARARVFSMRVHGGFAFAMYYHLQQLSNNNNNSLGTFCFATRILYLYVY